MFSIDSRCCIHKTQPEAACVCSVSLSPLHLCVCIRVIVGTVGGYVDNVLLIVLADKPLWSGRIPKGGISMESSMHHNSCFSDKLQHERSFSSLGLAFNTQLMCARVSTVVQCVHGVHVKGHDLSRRSFVSLLMCWVQAAAAAGHGCQFTFGARAARAWFAEVCIFSQGDVHEQEDKVAC